MNSGRRKAHNRMSDAQQDALAVRHATCRVVIDALQLVYVDSPLTSDDREAIERAIAVFTALLSRAQKGPRV